MNLVFKPQWTTSVYRPALCMLKVSGVDCERPQFAQKSLEARAAVSTEVSMDAAPALVIPTERIP